MNTACTNEEWERFYKLSRPHGAFKGIEPNPYVTEAIALLESGPKNRPALVASLGTELRVIEPTLTRLAQALDLKIKNCERHIFGHGRADARLDHAHDRQVRRQAAEIELVYPERRYFPADARRQGSGWPPVNRIGPVSKSISGRVRRRTWPIRRHAPHPRDRERSWAIPP